MIGRTTRWGGHGALEPKRVEIKGVNEGIDEADRVVCDDILVKARRKEHDRVAVSTLDVWHGMVFL
jgi:hypothetical protein